MGWTFPWYSSQGSGFNYDFHATIDDRVAPVQIFYKTGEELTAAGWSVEDMRREWPGISAFLRIGDEVFHTYSTYGRGIEEFHHGYPHLDLTALGRQEAWEEPQGRAQPLGLQVGGPRCACPTDTTPKPDHDPPGRPPGRRPTSPGPCPDRRRAPLRGCAQRQRIGADVRLRSTCLRRWQLHLGTRHVGSAGEAVHSGQQTGDRARCDTFARGVILG